MLKSFNYYMWHVAHRSFRTETNKQIALSKVCAYEGKDLSSVIRTDYILWQYFNSKFWGKGWQWIYLTFLCPFLHFFLVLLLLVLLLFYSYSSSSSSFSSSFPYSYSSSSYSSSTVCVKPCIHGSHQYNHETSFFKFSKYFEDQPTDITTYTDACRRLKIVTQC